MPAVACIYKIMLDDTTPSYNVAMRCNNNTIWSDFFH